MEYSAMAFIGHRSSKNLRTFNARREVRKELLPNFPKGSEISYRWDDVPLGKVTKHDLVNGRVETDTGGSHDPNEIKVLVLPPKRA